MRCGTGSGASSRLLAAGRARSSWSASSHRLRGHYEGDPGKYREAIAADEWQKQDPILRLQRLGVEKGWFGEDDCAAAEREAAEVVDRAVEFGRESDYPAFELVAELTYAGK